MQLTHLSRAVAATALLVAAGGAHALATHDASQFTTALAANDDESMGPVTLGFDFNFFGTTGNQAYVNNNGNITFGTPLATFTPFGIRDNTFPIIAPFFADVDTRGAGSGLTTYGTGTIGGRAAFGVNWIDVGYFSLASDKLNSFQLILTDRADTGAGNFDIQFNYDRILWETGDLSGGGNGFGGTSAAVGYTAGDALNFFEFAGSRVPGSFLDSSTSSGLIHNSLNSSTLGQYNFQVRGGTVVPPTEPPIEPPIPAIPEPETYALTLLGLATLGAVGRRRKAQRG